MADMVKEISNMLIISPEVCHEQFMYLQIDSGRALRDLGVDLAGSSRLRPPYHLERADADFYVVIFTTGGKAVWETMSDKGEFLPGTVWICPVDTPHRYWTDDYWECSWFHIRRRDHHSRRVIPNITMRQLNVTGSIRQIMESYISETINRPRGWEEICRLQAGLLACYLMRELENHACGYDEASAALPLASLWEKVDMNLSRPWSLETMAKELHCSVSTLERMTRERHFLSPMRMVETLRMNRTKELLKDTCYSLDLIAELVGYGTGFSLSKAFRRYAGISPKEYRRRLGQLSSPAGEVSVYE